MLGQRFSQADANTRPAEDNCERDQGCGKRTRYWSPPTMYLRKNITTVAHVTPAEPNSPPTGR
jgi:hypothetical protein